MYKATVVPRNRLTLPAIFSNIILFFQLCVCLRSSQICEWWIIVSSVNQIYEWCRVKYQRLWSWTIKGYQRLSKADVGWHPSSKRLLFWEQRTVGTVLYNVARDVIARWSTKFFYELFSYEQIQKLKTRTVCWRVEETNRKFVHDGHRITSEDSKDLGGCIFKLLLLELIGDAIELEVDKCFNDIGKKPKKYESSILLLCTVYLLHLWAKRVDRNSFVISGLKVYYSRSYRFQSIAARR